LVHWTSGLPFSIVPGAGWQTNWELQGLAILNGNPGRVGTFLDRRNGATYRATLDGAAASDPDWILITSWNEWWENTHIEPSVNFGDQYLQITREFAARWKQQ